MESMHAQKQFPEPLTESPTHSHCTKCSNFYFSDANIMACRMTITLLLPKKKMPELSCMFVYIFIQHLMEEYRPKMSRAYLEVEPQKYNVPMMPADFTEIVALKPDVKTVSVYKYPSEHIVVLEGNNLWFCHEVHLGEKENKFRIKNSEAVTGRSIQFNYEPTEKSDHLVTDQKVKVALHSHFSNPIRRQIVVEQVWLIYEKEYYIFY